MRYLVCLVLVFIQSVCWSSAVTTPTAVFRDSSVTLTKSSFPACAWNSHAQLVRSSNASMFQLGDSTSVQMSFTGSWDDGLFTTLVPTFPSYINPLFGSQTPAARLASAAVVLGNGNLVWFGGKAMATGNYTNDVIYSTNQAQSFILATLNAPWPARSDFSAACAPNSNMIVITGGQGWLPGTTTGTSFNDGTSASTHFYTSHIHYEPLTSILLTLSLPSVFCSLS
jgi:hypothetical protein